MEEQKKTKGFSLKEVIFIILLTAIISGITTGVILYNQNKITKNITYQDLNQDEDLKEFLSVYASLLDEYYEDVNKKGMLESAIEAMFKYLGEDYSTYMNKEETEALSDKLIGEYKGIGVTLNSNNEIIDFNRNGSAVSSGLMLGDKIVAINNEEISTNVKEAVANYITNKDIGEKLTLTVERENNKLNYDVEIKKLYIPVVNGKMLENNIGYLQISTFSGTLKEQVQDVLGDLEKENMNSLIIDLRNNTGGYLVGARDVASMFLEKNKIIYSLQEKDETENILDETDEKRDYKIVILMNDSSASASEILIAALKESYGAITVGTKTYGKGKVQQTHTLDDGSMIKYTTAKWLTPNGTCIDGEGLTPDYYVLNDTDREEDKALNKAIELLSE